jgi:hypothetical protein
MCESPLEKLRGGHEAMLEFLLGGDADVAQDRTGEFGKKLSMRLSQGESEFETVCGLTGATWPTIASAFMFIEIPLVTATPLYNSRTLDI